MVEEYPRNLTELEASFGTEEACRAYLARLRWQPVMACTRGAAGVRGVWLPNFSDGGNGLPGQPDAVAGMVPRHVVGDHAEERRQRVRTATSAWPEEV